MAKSHTTTSRTDIQIQHRGELVLFFPRSNHAMQWINENTNSEAMFFAGALICEPRFARDLIQGMSDAGLAIVQ